MSKLSDIIVAIRADLTQFNQKMKEWEGGMRRAGRRMSVIGAEMTTALTLPIVGVGIAAVKSFADIEKMQLSLAAVMGSSEAAAAEFQKLVETARQPGLGLQQTLDASVGLQSMGVEANKARRIIEGFGKATIFSGKGADEFSRALIQMQQAMSIGKITEMDLRLMKLNIPAIGRAMTEAFGTTNTELIRANNSIDEFVTKLVDAMHALPVTDDMVNSLSNQWQNFTDELKIALAELGKVIVVNLDLKDRLKGVIATITGVTKSFSELSPGMQDFILKGIACLALLGPLLRLFGNLGIVLSVVLNVFKNLAKVIGVALSPIAAIVALASTFIILLDKWRKAADNAFVRALTTGLSSGILPFIDGLKWLWNWLFKTKEGVRELAGGLKSMQKHKVHGADFVKIQEPGAAPPDLPEKTPIQDILAGLKKDINAAHELNKLGMISDIKEHLRDVYVGAIESLAREGLKADSKIMKDLFAKAFPDPRGVNLFDMLPPLKLPDRISSLEGFDLSKYITQVDPNPRDFDAYASKVIDALGSGLTTFGGKIGAILSNLFSFDAGNGGGTKMASFIDSMKEDFIAVADTIGTIISGIDDIFTASFDARSQALDNYYDKEKARIEGSMMSEEAKAKALAKLEEETEKKRRKIARQKAIREKLAAIFGATINTALAITKFLAEGNAAAAIAAGILGAIQIGVIASAPIPLASGGLAYGEVNARIGEYMGAHNNPEVVSPLSDLKEMLFKDQEASMRGGEVVFEIRGSTLVGVLKQALRDSSSSGGYKIG